MCEVRVSGIPYVGAGNSTNKKDAEKNAARDFINFLVRSGQLDANEVPANAIEQGGALPTKMTQASESVPVFQVIIILCNSNIVAKSQQIALKILEILSPVRVQKISVMHIDR